jgi:hypothetical protein
MHEVPPDWMVSDGQEKEAKADMRIKDAEEEGKRQHEAEFYEDEKDQDEHGRSDAGAAPQ